MGGMANLDIKLSEHKLSDAQKNAVLDILTNGWSTAKPNTLRSLENRGLIVKVSETHHNLSDDFQREIDEWHGAVSQVDEIQEELNTNMWEAPVITEEETAQFQEIVKTEFDHFDSKWEPQLKRTAGFGETLKWSNTQVWDGLTASEIREDLDTAAPINRKARRLLVREMNNARRRRVYANPSPYRAKRKQIKICGGKG